jgi:hypothetical protein
MWHPAQTRLYMASPVGSLNLNRLMKAPSASPEPFSPGLAISVVGDASPRWAWGRAQAKAESDERKEDLLHGFHPATTR